MVSVECIAIRFENSRLFFEIRNASTHSSGGGARASQHAGARRRSFDPQKLREMSHSAEPSEHVLRSRRLQVWNASISREVSEAVWSSARDDELRELFTTFPDALTIAPLGPNASLLHLAARAGNRAAAALAIEKGADIGLCDCDGRTPVHVAAAYGHEGVLTALLLSGDARAMLSAPDLHGATPLKLAFDHSHGAIVDTMLGILDGTAPLGAEPTAHQDGRHGGDDSDRHLVPTSRRKDVSPVDPAVVSHDAVCTLIAYDVPDTIASLHGKMVAKEVNKAKRTKELTPIPDADTSVAPACIVHVHKNARASTLGVAMCNSSQGVFVSRVEPAGVGKLSGLKVGQIVRAINGVPIDSVDSALLLVASAVGTISFTIGAHPMSSVGFGDTNERKVIRRDGPILRRLKSHKSTAWIFESNRQILDRANRPQTDRQTNRQSNQDSGSCSESMPDTAPTTFVYGSKLGRTHDFVPALPARPAPPAPSAAAEDDAATIESQAAAGVRLYSDALADMRARGVPEYVARMHGDLVLHAAAPDGTSDADGRVAALRAKLGDGEALVELRLQPRPMKFQPRPVLGIGVGLDPVAGAFVSAVAKGSAAEHEGVKVGDRIALVNGVLLQGMDGMEAGGGDDPIATLLTLLARELSASRVSLHLLRGGIAASRLEAIELSPAETADLAQAPAYEDPHQTLTRVLGVWTPPSIKI